MEQPPTQAAPKKKVVIKRLPKKEEEAPAEQQPSAVDFTVTKAISFADIDRKAKKQLAKLIQRAENKALQPIPPIQSIEEWAQARYLNPEKYTFTPAGDLVGADQTVLEMHPKVHATPEVIQQRLEEKKAKIAEAEAKFTKARRDLYQVIAQHRADPTATTVGDVITANQAVHTADCELALVAKYPRYVQEKEGAYIFRDLHLDDFYNVRKFPDPVLEIEYTTFPLELFWSDRQQEKIALEGLADEYNPFDEQPNEEQAKKDAARTGAIIAANKAKAAASMAGRA